MTTVLNFFAGPGAGKSTMAARLFTELKVLGAECELVTEFAKDLTWEERNSTLTNQLYILAKQHHRMFRLYNKVDFIITDSPLLLSLHYAKVLSDQKYAEKLRELALHLHGEMDSVNYLICRTKPYQKYGRSQTEAEAKEIDSSLKSILETEGVEFRETPTGFKAVSEIVSQLGIE